MVNAFPWEEKRHSFERQLLKADLVLVEHLSVSQYLCHYLSETEEKAHCSQLCCS